MHIQPHRTAGTVARCGSIVAPALAIAFFAALSAGGARGAMIATERYVNQAYTDLLSRPPDPTELSTFAGGLDAMTLTRPAFVSTITGSAEYSDGKTSGFFTLLLHRSSVSA